MPANKRVLADYTVEPNAVPRTLYYVPTTQDSPDYDQDINAPDTVNSLSSADGARFRKSLRALRFPNPWIPVFSDKKEAKGYALQQGVIEDIYEIDGSKLQTVIQVPQADQDANTNFKSEMLVLHQIPKTAIISGYEEEDTSSMGSAIESNKRKRSNEEDEEGRVSRSKKLKREDGRDLGHKIRRILADELRWYTSNSYRVQSYLVEWGRSRKDEGRWKPSWCQKNDVHPEEVEKYQRKKRRWDRDAGTQGQQGRVTHPWKILFEERISDGKRQKGRMRYLVEWQEDTANSWVWKDEVTGSQDYKDIETAFENHKENWQRLEQTL